MVNSSAVVREQPPRARGRRACARPSRAPSRATPARAGTTDADNVRVGLNGSNPRGRGDDLWYLTSHCGVIEQPPRARGRPEESRLEVAALGATPAGAGTTWIGSTAAPRGGSNPRGRGDDYGADPQGLQRIEQPPRARGRPGHRRGSRRPGRATPAGAGTTSMRARRTSGPRSNPRGRGDDPKPIAILGCGMEQPPRARGRPPTGSCPRPDPGATPAGAGTTTAPCSAARGGGSNPRGRGDDAAGAFYWVGLVEQPPRARGRRGLLG